MRPKVSRRGRIKGEEIGDEGSMTLALLDVDQGRKSSTAEGVNAGEAPEKAKHATVLTSFARIGPI